MKMRNAVMAAALSGPLVLLAGDFWRDKEPSQWSSEEVNQILTKSPWAKQVTASSNENGGGGRGNRGGMGGPGMGGGGMGGPGMGGPGMGGPGMGGPGMGGPGMGGGGLGGPGTGGGGWGGRRGGTDRRGDEREAARKLTVRWESAAPVREALVKSESADASKFADWSKDYYVVTVSGLPPMGQHRRRGGDDDQQPPDPDRAKEMQERMQERLKQTTTLKVKDKTVAPERIETFESPSGRTLAFLFPRTANILPDDKEVSFATSMGPMEIKSKFALKEMQFKGKLEL
jgi:hypothetical protein